MSYFHTGIRTIIGAEAFHGPVRDGKEWDHLAMVIRHNFRSLLLPAAEPIRRVGRLGGTNQILDCVLRFEERQFTLARPDDRIVKIIGSSRTSN